MVHPAAHGLIGDQDPTLSQQILDVAEAQGEPDIKPDRLLDDFGREAVAAIADLGHHRWLRLKVTDGKPNGDVTMPETVLMGRIRAQAGRRCGAAAFIKIYYGAGRLLLRNFALPPAGECAALVVAPSSRAIALHPAHRPGRWRSRRCRCARRRRRRR